MAEYLAMAEYRKEVFREAPQTDGAKVLKILKEEVLEKKMVYVESLCSEAFEACKQKIFARDEFERKRRMRDFC